MKPNTDITTTRRAIWLSMSAMWLFMTVIFSFSTHTSASIMLVLGLIMVPFNYFQTVFLLWLGRKLERMIWKNKDAWE